MSNPDQVKYSTNPVEGVAANSELVIFRSELPEYNPSSNKFIRINLPVASKGWVDWSDSVLSLKFTNRSHQTDSASTSESAVKTQLNNLIKSVTILNSQGEQIEYIQEYGLISNIMDDLSVSEDHKKSVQQVLGGGSADGNPDSATEIAGANATSEADGSSLVMVDRLMTGFTSGTYLSPLGYLIGNACAIVLELQDPNTALKINTAANGVCAYKVTDVEIRAKQILFNSAFNADFEQGLMEAGTTGINYVTESFIHAQGSLNNGVSGVQNIPFSMNPRSALYILAAQRKETDVTAVDKYSLGVRSSCALSDYQWEVSGKAMPTQPIKLADDNYAQGYANILDCLGIIGAINHSNLVTSAGTNTRFYARDATTASKYVSGLVLEDFNSATNPSVYSGMNLSVVGQMLYRPNLASALSGAHRVDFFCSHNISFHFTIYVICKSFK